MNKTLNKKLFIILSCVLIAITSFSVAISLPNTAKADFTIGDFEKEYFVGDTLNVPNATVSVNGSEVAAKFEIVCPDGDVFANQSLLLTQYGKYTIKYYVEGTTLSRSVNIAVDKPLYYVEGKGNVQYGYHPYLDEEIDGQLKQYGGMITSIASGSKLVLNKVINLAELGPNDAIIKINITPSVRGQVDFERINIRLTDVYDSSKYVILRTKDQEYGDGDYLSYSLCSINSETLYYRNYGIYHAGTLVGTEVLCSFRGTPGYDPDVPDVYKEFRNYAKDTVDWYLDYADQALYVIGGNKAEKKLVCDLDATGAWDIFTTGEVKMEIFADTYTNTYANFVVREIAGCEIAQNVLVDNQAPQISVDFEDYTENNYPQGKVGYAYNIFKATALDLVDGNVPVNVMVYKNYYSNNKIAVNVKNGAFLPTQAGVYTVCYTACDKFGNKSIETIDINIVDSENEIVIDFGERILTAKQNQIVEIAEVTTNGGFGNKTIEKEVTFNGENIALFGNTFTPMQVGEYTVTYTVTDYIGQVKTDSYTIDVEHNSKLSISGQIDNLFERFYIKGFTYQIPEIDAYLFDANGQDYQLKKAVVSTDNGTINNGKYIPKTTGNVTFTFSVDGNTSDVTVTKPVYDVKTDDGKKLDATKFFVHEEHVKSGFKDEYSIYYSFNQDATFSFINSLLAESFSAQLKNDDINSNASGFIVTLTDSRNLEQSVCIKFVKSSTTTLFYLNGVGKEVDTRTSFTGGEFSFNLRASSGEFTANGYSATFKEYLSGEKYKGFNSDLIYCDVTFFGMENKLHEVVFKSICAQTFSQRGVDNNEPLITYVGELPKIVDLNGTYTLPKVLAADVLSPSLLEFYVTVTDPNDDYVTVNGVQLNYAPIKEYAFTLDKYGEYFITYTAVDANGNPAELYLDVSVLDFEPPTVEISNNKTVSAKVGDTVKVAKLINMEDNYGKISGDSGYYVMVKYPTGKIIVLETYVDGKIQKQVSFKANVAGQYVVYFYVRDYSEDSVCQGNVTVLSYTVTVS